MKQFEFEIPITGTETVIVTADDIKAALDKMLEGEYDQCYTTETVWQIGYGGYTASKRAHLQDCLTSTRDVADKADKADKKGEAP